MKHSILHSSRIHFAKFLSLCATAAAGARGRYGQPRVHATRLASLCREHEGEPVETQSGILPATWAAVVGTA